VLSQQSLGAPICARRQGRELSGHVEGSRFDLSHRVQLIQRSPPERLLGARRARRKHEAAGRLAAQLRPHQLQRRNREGNADPDLGEAELVLAPSSDAIVAGDREDEPSGDGVAVDCSDDGTRETVETEESLEEP
jgi:hypothetical protein